MSRNDHRFFGWGLPNVDPSELQGKLIVVEGQDCSGRSTQVYLLKEWLERHGYAVLTTGLRRSALVSDAIRGAKEGHFPARTSLSLLYATDFADQLENKIVPALKSGFVVLADRYVFTLMARDRARGISREWLEKVLGFAVVPDIVFFLRASEDVLLHRAFAKYGYLDYWEAGMDLWLSRNMVDSFLQYQRILAGFYEEMAARYGFVVLDAEQDIRDIQLALREQVAPLVGDIPPEAVDEQNILLI